MSPRDSGSEISALSVCIKSARAERALACVRAPVYVRASHVISTQLPVAEGFRIVIGL